jgi:hypothetical protein
MPIKNLSDARRMPRLGKIHLGIKKDKKKDGTPCAPYPTEVEYFVCPPEVQAVFGEKPTTLKIMVPVEETERFFPQYYKRYTISLLQCKGDGEKAFCWAEEGGLKEIPCPCDYLKSGECKQIGIFCFLIPDVQGFGIYQITTSSKNSIIDLNSSLDMICAIAGRIRMIPLILRREKMEMQRIEDGKPKKSSHYTLRIDLDEKMTLRQLQQAGQTKPETILLPPPDEDKDDLFYPPNGFKPTDEEEKVEEQKEKLKDAAKAKEDDEKRRAAEKEAFEKAELVKAGHDLEALLRDYQELGGKVGNKQAERIGELKATVEIKKAIEFFRIRLDKLKADGEIPF